MSTCPRCGAPETCRDGRWQIFACDARWTYDTDDFAPECPDAWPRIRELEAALLAKDETIGELQERWRLMGDWFAEADTSDEPFSIAWRNGYDHAIVDAQERYNELTPNSGSAAGE